MKLRIFFLLALLLLPRLIAPTPEDTSDPEHPFAKYLSSLYISYLDSAREGDVVSAMDKMTAKHSQMFSNITPELLKRMCEGELDPRDSSFIKVETDNDTARVIYMKEVEHLTNWQAVFFKLEYGRWKIANIANIVRYKNDNDSEEDILALLIGNTKSFERAFD